MEAPRIATEPTPATIPERIAATEPPMTIAMQPVPYEVSLIVTPDNAWSSLVRKFRPDEVARCRLCPLGTCCASGDQCHMMVEGAIPPGQAAMYSSLGLPRVPAGLARPD